jgi:hypothetical protein
LAAYGLGATDDFQGTGVFSGFKMSRDKKPEEGDERQSTSAQATKESSSCTTTTKEPVKGSK